MSDFSQLLSCHIHSKDIKTYALAQYCGLDRSNIQIINGKRKPSSWELVFKDMQIYAAFRDEQKEMEQAYIITLIGHDTYYRREKAVVDFFNNFRLSKLNLLVLSELNTEILFEKDLLR